MDKSHPNHILAHEQQTILDEMRRNEAYTQSYSDICGV